MVFYAIYYTMNKNGKIKNIPVFLITAADDQEILLEAFGLGAVDVIMKPFIAQFSISSGGR